MIGSGRSVRLPRVVADAAGWRQRVASECAAVSFACHTLSRFPPGGDNDWQSKRG